MSTSATYQRIAVIGAGTMGNGIAQTFASYGTTVQLVDVNEAALEKGLATVEKSLGRFVKKENIKRTDRMPVPSGEESSTSLFSFAK